MGETTATIADAHPQHDFLGVEVHAPGVGALLKEVAARGLSNVRVVQPRRGRRRHADDSRRTRSPACTCTFPIRGRRSATTSGGCCSRPFVHLLATRIAPGGYLHAATDWEEYAQEILATFTAEPLLANTADGFAPRPAWRPQTKFETRGLKLGHGTWDVLFRRGT